MIQDDNKHQKHTEFLVNRSRQRFEHRRSEQQNKALFDAQQSINQSKLRENTKRNAQGYLGINEQIETRIYPKRYIYFILDGQHALKTPNLLFSHIEVNHKLCKLIPQKTWDSQAS